MTSKNKLFLIIALTATVGFGLLNLCHAAILKDSMEDSTFWTQWSLYGGVGGKMELDQRNAHTGVNSGLAQPNWNYPYTMSRVMPTAYTENIYFSAWVLDDCTIPPGLPGPPDNPNWSQYHVPNEMIRLVDSNGFDYLHLGPIGKEKASTVAQYPQNIFFSIETKADGVKILNGAPVSPLPIRREPGWRKWMIRVKPYTGTKGDVEFYVDGQLAYQGKRSVGPMGAATLDTLVLGSYNWTAAWTWYDDVELDYWPSNPALPVNIASALQYQDDTCISMNGLVVDKVYKDFITVQDASGTRLDVYPARFEAPGDVVSVLGKLATSADGRYLDALTVTCTTAAPQVQATTLAQARALPDGTRVKLPQRVVTASLASVRFVQEDRKSGLKIRNIYEPKVKDAIVVEGQMMSDGPEKLLEAEKVTISSINNVLPLPVGVTNKVLYDPNVSPNGMLIITTGKVVNRPGSGTWYPAWCEIKDGSQSPDAPPVRVLLPSWRSCPLLGDYIWVRGTAGMLVEKTGVKPQVYCYNLTDIRVIKPAQ